MGLSVAINDELLKLLLALNTLRSNLHLRISLRYSKKTDQALDLRSFPRGLATFLGSNFAAHHVFSIWIIKQNKHERIKK